MAPSSQPPAPVPDALLALAQTARYSSYLSGLIGDVLGPHLHLFARAGRGAGPADSSLLLPPSSPSSPELLQWLRPELDLLASLVHALLLVWGEGRTLGMDHLGLEYGPAEASRGGGGGGGEGGAKAAGGGARGLPSRLGGSRTRAALLVALTVAPPYLAARCGRPGGSSAPFAVAGEDGEPGPGQGQGQGAPSGWVAVDDPRSAERLRGQARRELFEERRRRMVRLASRIERSSAGGSGSCSGSCSDEDQDEVNLDDDQDEVNLDDDRRDRARAQRTATPSPPDPVDRSRDSLDGRTLTRARSKYLVLLRALAARAASGAADWFTQAHLAALAVPPAAHSIPRPLAAAGIAAGGGGGGEGGWREEDRSLPRGDGISDSDLVADSRANLIGWIVRLNLALFYLNGRYPTLAHRVAGVRMIGSGPGDNCSSEGGVGGLGGSVSPGLTDRPSYRIVGVLVMAEAGAALVGAFRRALVEVAHAWQIRRASRSSRGGASSTAASVARGAAAVERERTLALVERRVPSVLSHERSRQAVGREGEENGDPRPAGAVDSCSSATSRSTCGICLQKRDSPAAPTSCGHVFCWGCIQHWVSTVRPECPLCRAPARPQDILPLYNY